MNESLQSILLKFEASKLSSGIKLKITKRTDYRLLARMKIHYSQPKGFVGRNICYAIYYNGIYYGHIVGGSAVMWLVGRDEFFYPLKDLNTIVNNIFYNVSSPTGKYPIRNFTSKILLYFEQQIAKDWAAKYGDRIVGFESLVELPRTGELYLKAGYTLVGQTKGFTCKRTGGTGTDSWSGKRVWNTDEDDLRPKLVFCHKL